MLLGGSGSLEREREGAKIDCEISICILCTHTDEVWLIKKEIKGEYIRYFPAYLLSTKLLQPNFHHNATFWKRCSSCMPSDLFHRALSKASAIVDF